MRELLSVYLKGLCMGAAEAVPGVSGGTIALITGIYDRLVSAIASFDPRVVESLVRPHDPGERAKVREMLASMDLGFLVVLGAGMMTTVITVTGVITAAAEQSPGLLYAFFFGLIAASAVVLYGEASVDTPSEIAAAVAGFAFAFVVASPGVAGALPHSLPMVFLSGAIAITAMVLPGVSGSLLLLMLGQYIFMTETLHEFVGGVASAVNGGTVAALVTPGAVVVAFCLGAGLGVLSVAKAVSWALDNYQSVTLTFLVSLMVGALRYPAEKVAANLAPVTTTHVAEVVIAAVAGGALVLLVDYYTDDLDY